jgi:hypothetical protein
MAGFGGPETSGMFTLARAGERLLGSPSMDRDQIMVCPASCRVVDTSDKRDLQKEE